MTQLSRFVAAAAAAMTFICVQHVTVDAQAQSAVTVVAILEEAAVLFRDTRPEDVDADQHDDFVIARVPDFGTVRSVRSLLRLYGRDRVRRFFLEGGASRVSRRTIPLWMAFLNLTADECTPRSSPRRSSPFWNA